MSNAYRGINLRTTPQTQPARTDQVKNNAGGFVFTLDPMAQARRFLILGTDQPTYYQTAPALTRQNAGVILELAQSRPLDLVNLIVDISIHGTAPKQDPALFALAIVAGTSTPDGKAAARAVIPVVARTGTALFKFVTFYKQFGGVGRGIRTAISNWYTAPDVEKVAYQAIKYRQRDGMTHRDVLRIAHPKTTEPARRALFQWVASQGASVAEPELLPAIVDRFERAQTADAQTAVDLILQGGLPWEALPDRLLTEAAVWMALIQSHNLPLGAMIRQLPRLTRLGIFDDMQTRDQVTTVITDPEVLRKARVHPLNQLLALRTYAAGHSARGNSEWAPNPNIIDALDESFYKAFHAFEPAGKRTLVALDVSPSMWGSSDPSGLMSAAEIAGALAMTMVATEPQVSTVAFASGGLGGTMGYGYRRAGIAPINLSSRQRLDDVLRTTHDFQNHWAGTDCALPMLYADQNGVLVDTFVVITDNDTWAGDVHPYQALRDYRNHSGIDARLVVLATSASPFTIADPKDSGMLDVAGFGSDVPALVTAFSRGDI